MDGFAWRKASSAETCTIIGSTSVSMQLEIVPFQQRHDAPFRGCMEDMSWRHSSRVFLLFSSSSVRAPFSTSLNSESYSGNLDSENIIAAESVQNTHFRLLLDTSSPSVAEDSPGEQSSHLLRRTCLYSVFSCPPCGGCWARSLSWVRPFLGQAQSPIFLSFLWRFLVVFQAPLTIAPSGTESDTNPTGASDSADISSESDTVIAPPDTTALAASSCEDVDAESETPTCENKGRAFSVYTGLLAVVGITGAMFLIFGFRILPESAFLFWTKLGVSSFGMFKAEALSDALCVRVMFYALMYAWRDKFETSLHLHYM